MIHGRLRTGYWRICSPPTGTVTSQTTGLVPRFRGGSCAKPFLDRDGVELGDFLSARSVATARGRVVGVDDAGVDLGVFGEQIQQI